VHVKVDSTTTATAMAAFTLRSEASRRYDNLVQKEAFDSLSLDVALGFFGGVEASIEES